MWAWAVETPGPVAASPLNSVTANTRADGEELLRLAPRLGVQVHVTEYSSDRLTGRSRALPRTG